MIQAAINGVRSKLDNSFVPVYSEEILKEAIESINAGAREIHFHVRDKNGIETLDSEYVAEQVSLLKTSLKNTPIGISTGEWIEPDFDKRKSLIDNWTIYPDFVSLNISERNFETIAKSLIEKNISIEAGLTNSEDAIKLLETGLYKHCFRFLIEPQEDNINDALTNINSIEKIIKPIISGHSVLLHGFDNTVWDLLLLAFQKGYETRIGFEDTIVTQSKKAGKSNAQLINEAKAFVTKNNPAFTV